MTPRIDSDELVWQRTLEHVRAARQRRSTRRTGIAVSVVVCAGYCVWLSLRTGLPVNDPVVASSPPPPPPGMLVEMKVGPNGSVRLEEVTASELGNQELSFTLGPVVLDGPMEW